MTYRVKCVSKETFDIMLAYKSKDMLINLEWQICIDVDKDVRLWSNVEQINKSNLEVKSVLETILPLKEIENLEIIVHIVQEGEALFGGRYIDTFKDKNQQQQQTNDDDLTLNNNGNTITKDFTMAIIILPSR